MFLSRLVYSLNKKTPQHLRCSFGRGGRNRTHAKGFGDPCTTTILLPLRETLFGLFVMSVFFTVTAIFLQF